MKKRNFILLFTMAANITFVFAQSRVSPNFTQPAPTSASLAKYAQIPVSTYTGIPQIAVPIFNIKVRDISVPISLSYHAGGVRVEEEAGMVGLGWSLNAGGVITRQVVNRDDLHVRVGSPPVTGRYFNDGATPLLDLPKDVNFIPAYQALGVSSLTYRTYDKSAPLGIYVPIKNAITGQTTQLNFSSYLSLRNPPPNTRATENEYEPDIYSYNFLGYTGRFILGRDKEVYLEKKEKIKIEYIKSGADIDYWLVTTPDGKRFTFGSATTDEGVEYYNSVYYPPQSELKVKTAWYLTQIVSPLNETVIFKYAIESQNGFRASQAFVQQRLVYFTSLKNEAGGGFIPISPSDISVCAQSASNEPPSAPALPASLRDNVVARLQRIEFSTGQVSFEYEGGRLDLLGDKMLKKIKFDKRENATLFPLNECNLTYGYFDGASGFYPQGESDLRRFRLKLKQVQVKSLIDAANYPPYTFSYINESGGASTPTKLSASKDFWGYYNGAPNAQNYLPSTVAWRQANSFSFFIKASDSGDRAAQNVPSQVFTLNEIQYPEGGKQVFEYEVNDYDPRNSGVFDDLSILLENKSAIFQIPASAFNTSNRTVNRTLDLTKVIPPIGVTIRNPAISSDATGNNFAAVSPNYSTDVTVTVVLRFKTTCQGQITNESSGDVKFTMGPVGVLSFFKNLFCNNGVPCPASGLCSTSTVPVPCISCQGQNPVLSYTNTYPMAALNQNFSINIGSLVRLTNLNDVRVIFGWKEMGGTKKLGGGLRVVKITEKTDNNTIARIRKYNYGYVDAQNVTQSYGRLMTKPRFTFTEYDWAAANFDDPSFYPKKSYCHKLYVSSESVSPANIMVSYDKVEELLGENGEFGKTVYEYKNSPSTSIAFGGDFRIEGIAIRHINYIPPYSPNLFADDNGLLAKKSDYAKTSSGYSVVSEMENTYTTTDKQIVYGIENWIKGQLDYSPVDKKYYPHFDAYGVRLMIYPVLKSVWSYLSQSTQRSYGTNGSILTSNSYYFYDNPNHLALTRQVTEKSDGRYNFSFSLYPEDYDISSGFIKAMTDKNIVTPIETVTGVGVRTTVGDIDYGSLKITGGSVSTYNVNCPVCLSKSSLLEIPSAKPINFSSFKFSNTNGAGKIPFGVDGKKSFAPHSNYADRVFYNAYDANNNLTQYTADGLVTSIVWTGIFPTLVSKNSNAANGAPALTTTYLYDPIFGITSQVAPNGIKTTFRYDGLGRLQEAKDSNGKIVKSYKYNYRP